MPRFVHPFPPQSHKHTRTHTNTHTLPHIQNSKMLIITLKPPCQILLFVFLNLDDLSPVAEVFKLQNSKLFAAISFVGFLESFMLASG